PLPPMGGKSAPVGVLHLERRRFLWERRMFERVRISNHGMEDVSVPMSFDYAADFADIFDVRGSLRPLRREAAATTTDGRRVTFRYTGLEAVERRSCVAFSEPPARMTAARAEFMFSLPRGRSLDLYVECGADHCDTPGPQR